MGQLDISAIIPAYDAALFIRECIDSILAQDVEGLEIIVVDDGSTDDTAALAETYGPPVRVVKQENWGGASRPRNVGFRMSQGRYVIFFDADDIMAPGALERDLDVFARHPEVDFVCAGSQAVDAAGRPLAGYLPDFRDFRRILRPTEDATVGLLSGPELYSVLVRSCFFGVCSALIDRTVLDQVGLFDESLKNGDDYDLWLRIAHAGYVFAYIDRVHFYYRQHENSVTRRGWRRLPSVMRRIEKNLAIAARAEDRRYLRRRMSDMKLGYAWGLREEGYLVEATSEYRAALRERFALRGITGLAKTLALRLSRRLRKIDLTNEVSSDLRN